MKSRHDATLLPLQVIIVLCHMNYLSSKADKLPASTSSQPTNSTGVNSGYSVPTQYFQTANNPCLRIFLAALISLSCEAPHSEHTHSRTFKSLTTGFLNPQQEQV